MAIATSIAHLHHDTFIRASQMRPRLTALGSGWACSDDERLHCNTTPDATCQMFGNVGNETTLRLVGDWLWFVRLSLQQATLAASRTAAMPKSWRADACAGVSALCSIDKPSLGHHMLGKLPQGLSKLALGRHVPLVALLVKGASAHCTSCANLYLCSQCMQPKVRLTR